MDSSSNAQQQAAKSHEEACVAAEPSAQHKWLEQLVGKWTYDSEALMAPDQPPAKFSGKETVRSLGGLWIIAEAEGDMPGSGTAQMMITLGYEPEKSKFIGTFVASMMTFMWHYEGELSADGRSLILSAVGPDMSPGAEPGKTALYHDIIEIVDNDHRILRSEMQTPDGSWVEFMKGNYTRVK